MPKVVDHQERRAEIAQIVIQTIAAHGMQGTTIRSVAREGGFSTGVLLHYFSNKESMIDFAFSAVADTIMERITERISLASSERERVRAVIEECLPISDTHGRETSVTISFWNEALHEADLRPLFADRYGRWRSLMESTLHQAAVTGELLPSGDIGEQVDLISATVDGLAVAWMIEGPGWSARRARAVDTILALAGEWHN